MELEVGSVVEGKVKTLTKFGAFVELDGEKTGMVHISEVASTYVKEITDYVSEGQEVKVKILSIDENGKISLSMKQVPGAVDKPQPREKISEKGTGERLTSGTDQSRRSRTAPTCLFRK